jgi:hypothetical protein
MHGRTLKGWWTASRSAFFFFEKGAGTDDSPPPQNHCSELNLQFSRRGRENTAVVRNVTKQKKKEHNSLNVVRPDRSAQLRSTLLYSRFDC